MAERTQAEKPNNFNASAPGGQPWQKWQNIPTGITATISIGLATAA
jgi:hypothetical protein